MSQLRLNPLTGRWVTVAAERASRPGELISRQLPVEADPSRKCPFCPGNEEATPPALETYGPGGTWLVRVVPNLFPAFEGSEPLRVQNLGPVFTQASASGVHEVLVFSPEHTHSVGRPRRQARRPRHGRDPRSHGGPRSSHHGAVHAGDRERRPGGGRVARSPARAAPRHPVRARRDRRGGGRLPTLRRVVPAVHDGRGRAPGGAPGASSTTSGCSWCAPTGAVRPTRCS